MSGWKCPNCGGGDFSLVTYERLGWSVCDGKMEIEESEGCTNLVGYQDEWECSECGWQGREAPPWSDD